MEFASFISNSKTFYFVSADLDGRINYTNNYFQAAFKHVAENFIGEQFSIILPSSEQELYLESVKKCIVEDIPQTVFLSAIHEEGSRETYIKWEFTLVNDKKTKSRNVICMGSVSGTIAVSHVPMTDVTVNNGLKYNDDKNLLDFLISSLPGIFYLQDESGKYLLWNKETENVTGYSKIEIAVMDRLSFFDYNDKERMIDATNKALEYGNAELEAQIITKNSKRIPHYFIIRSIYFEDKQYYIGSGIDISEEIKTLLQMQLSESTFRSAFEFSAFGMALVSPDGRWLKVNNELCNLLGYSEMELLSSNMLDITHTDDLAKTQNILREFLEGGIETGRLEKRYVHKMGNIIWANISMSLIRDRGGMPLYFVSQIEDITDRKEYEGKINNQIALLSEISFITSHELRHEYAKLHSVVNFLKDRQDIFTEKEDQFLIRESIKAFNNINSSIYKINDKITFGQFMEINLSGNNRLDHERILLVDDDPIANYVNTKLMEKHFDKSKIFSVNSSDQGMQHLKNYNSKDDYIILLDLNMPNKTGWDFLDDYKASGFTSPVVILTSSISLMDRDEAKKYEVIKKFISKPLTDEAAMQIKNMK